ncbi:MAG: hypothetical protein RIS29_2434 [Bacteroidota bacterium]|jgi:hypothetical protein
MDKISRIAKRHRSSVAFVFKKYGIQKMPTPKALAEAIFALKDTDFFRDLNNAIIKNKLGHNSFEDNFDYYLVDEHDSFDDGGETVGFYYDDEDDFDDFGGKRKEKKQARKVKRKAKKDAKKAKKSGASAVSAGAGSIADAEFEEVARTAGDKAEMAGNILGNLVQAGTNIAGAVMGGRAGGNDISYEEIEDPDAAVPSTSSGSKKYLPYIIGGVVLLAVFGGLIFFLKRKK